ncbi:MAG: hypothetical protein PF442_03135 [Desulfobulbaceae bacterium]|jgi:hypothetical protein|nr:hypothetical protein [Desulfobulbaceae bacterium]
MTEEHWQCWKITGCNKKDRCPAGQQEGKECWEIVQEMDDYRSSMKVCEDCLVYLSKEKNSVLSKDEIVAILKQKGVCILASKCLDDE